ncbi:hypothetical protein [Hyphomicrobium methylovorum]|uniref:hypothetical protein n=1 Tax=Hyphomicrobium methylovorum TaxID=84 RepID=UPI0015E63E7A|nr:hypothetical protein [Hyphomicrobium methylovorum]
MKIVLSALVAAVIATAGFAGSASALSVPAKPGVAAAGPTQVTFWKDGKKRDARRAHKRKHAHAHKSHKHSKAHRSSKKTH